MIVSYPMLVLRSTLHDFRLSSPSKVGRFWMLDELQEFGLEGEIKAPSTECCEVRVVGPPVEPCEGMNEDGPRPPMSKFC